MMVAINTAARICMKYDRNAMSEPTCIWPASIRRPPNQMSATLETLMVSVVTGNISACQRSADSAVSEIARLASANLLPLQRVRG